jgi:hypothetical protein
MYGTHIWHVYMARIYGTYETVMVRFWPLLQPLFRQKSLKYLKLSLSCANLGPWLEPLTGQTSAKPLKESPKGVARTAGRGSNHF